MYRNKELKEIDFKNTGNVEIYAFISLHAIFKSYNGYIGSMFATDGTWRHILELL